jgi:hypothetical protein
MANPNPAASPSMNIGQMLYANQISTQNPATASGLPNTNNGAFGGMKDNVGGDISGTLNFGSLMEIISFLNQQEGALSGGVFSPLVSGGIFANISTSMLPQQFKALLRLGQLANFAGKPFAKGILPSQQGQGQTLPPQ